MINRILGIRASSISKFESFSTTDVHLNEPLHEVIDIVNIFSCSDATLLSGQLGFPLSDVIEFIQRSDQHRHVFFVDFISLRVGLAHCFECVELNSHFNVDFIVNVDTHVLECDLGFFSAFDFVFFAFTDVPDVFFFCVFSFFKSSLLLEDLGDSRCFNAQFIEILFVFRQDV